jgi:hypothetical protein
VPRPDKPEKPQPSWAEIGSIFAKTFWGGIKGGLIVLALLLLGLFIYYVILPKFFLPMAGKCYQDESFSQCRYRLAAEEEKLERFETCQRSCGRGTGSQLCLEGCEYQYDMGKWKYATTYTSRSGQEFRCPQGQTGYQDAQGRGSCE